jgi:hypothetical protein
MNVLVCSLTASVLNSIPSSSSDSVDFLCLGGMALLVWVGLSIIELTAPRTRHPTLFFPDDTGPIDPVLPPKSQNNHQTIITENRDYHHDYHR